MLVGLTATGILASLHPNYVLAQQVEFTNPKRGGGKACLGSNDRVVSTLSGIGPEQTSPPAQAGGLVLEHFQQKCVAVLRWIMRKHKEIERF